MVNAVIIHANKKKINSDMIKRVKLACNNIIPDNMESEEPFIKTIDDIVVGLTYYDDAFHITKNGLLLGNVFKNYKNNWDKINSMPDGSFGIIRWDEKYIELLSDIGATRTIWYYSDKDYFIASTSQRMIITFLGNYQPNNEVVPWMMSTGAIGPLISWDKRIYCLASNQKLRFKKQKNKIKLYEEQPEFNQKLRTHKKFKQRLSDSIEKSLRETKINVDKHYLALSGGYDSRAILLHMENLENLHTITWGDKGGEDISQTDASIAKLLSKYFNTKHQYLELENKEASLDTIIERFIKNGEGRIDHITGYLDGFELWKNLKLNGVQGIIRGDEGFGWSNVNFPENVTQSIGISLLNEYENIPKWIKNLYAEQRIPKYLRRGEGESLAKWRDRLYQEYRVPTILAALTSLKTNYVEISNPLLTKLIINEVRTQPDKFRTDKSLFKEIVNKKNPGIAYAKHESTINLKDFLRNKRVVYILINKLQENKGDFIPLEVTDYIVGKLKYIAKEKRNIQKGCYLKEQIRYYLPTTVKNLLKKNMGKRIDINVLAFRVFIIIRMQEILNKDASVIK